MQLSYLLLFSLVALASARELPDNDRTQTSKCSATITANYDDRPRIPPVTTPVTTPDLGPYKGLTYNSIHVTTISAPLAGLKPASSPNVVSFGTFSVGSISNVTVIGGSGGFKSFNPKRIAYACSVASKESAVLVPVSCTIGFSGYKAGVQLVRQTVKYQVAIGEVNKGMSVASLQGLGGVDTVRVELVTGFWILLAGTIALDDFVYVGCS